jgi:hypothetical protein
MESGVPKRKLHSKAGKSSRVTAGADGSPPLIASNDWTATVSQLLLLLLLGKTELCVEYLGTDEASLTVVGTHDDVSC